MRGSESMSKPRIPWRASAGTARSRRAFSAAAAHRAARRGTGPTRARSRPRPRRRRSSAGARGGSSSDQSPAPMRTPRSRSIASASTSSSGPERGLTSASSARRGVGDRHERRAQRLGQSAQQRDDEFLAERGHEPLEVRLPHRPERRERDVDRDAVGRRAGVEAVGQRELQRTLLPARRPVTVVGRDVALDQTCPSGSRAASVGSGAPASTSGRSDDRSRRPPAPAPRRTPRAPPRSRAGRGAAPAPRAPRPPRRGARSRA